MVFSPAEYHGYHCRRSALPAPMSRAVHVPMIATTRYDGFPFRVIATSMKAPFGTRIGPLRAAWSEPTKLVLPLAQGVMLVSAERRQQITDDPAGSGLHLHRHRHARAKIDDVISRFQLMLVE